jgi:hypothetical protein
VPHICPEKAERRPHEHPHDCSTESMVPHEQVPQLIRQTEEPLPNRHVGQHVIDEMHGAFGHAATAATRRTAMFIVGRRSAGAAMDENFGVSPGDLCASFATVRPRTVARMNRNIVVRRCCAAAFY